jgi:hypothetical protein
VPAMSATGRRSASPSTSQCSLCAARHERPVSRRPWGGIVNSSEAGATTTVAGFRWRSHTTEARSVRMSGSAAKSPANVEQTVQTLPGLHRHHGRWTKNIRLDIGSFAAKTPTRKPLSQGYRDSGSGGSLPIRHYRPSYRIVSDLSSFSFQVYLWDELWTAWHRKT